MVAGGRIVGRGGLFSPDASILLVPHGCAVRAYATGTASPAFTLTAHAAPVTSLANVSAAAVNASDPGFVTAALDGTVIVWSWGGSGSGSSPPTLKQTFVIGAPIERCVTLGSGGGGGGAGAFPRWSFVTLTH